MKKALQDSTPAIFRKTARLQYSGIFPNIFCDVACFLFDESEEPCPIWKVTFSGGL